MEVYFDNLTSDKVSVNKLVEDVSSLVKDAEELVKASSDGLTESSQEKVKNALARVKSQSERIKEQAVAGARATDKMIRLHPYHALGVVFAAGLVMGCLFERLVRR